MTHVIISIGSNINREANVRFAVNAIKNKYGSIQTSPIYDTPACGFVGDNFLNVVVGFDCDISYQQLRDDLRAIEAQAGRSREQERYGNRTLDLDILLFGQADLRSQKINIPRDEIERHAFVLKPLSDLYPDLCHPISGMSYREMLGKLGNTDEIRRIDFDVQQSC